MEKVGLGAVRALAIRPLSQPCNHYTTTSVQSHSSPEQHLKTQVGGEHSHLTRKIRIFQCQTGGNSLQTLCKRKHSNSETSLPSYR